MIRIPVNKLFLDSRRNAALASLLPAAVKALTDAVEDLKYDWTKPMDIKKLEKRVEGYKSILRRISEATKAVEGK